MCRLIRFELQKVWCRRGFVLAVCALLFGNVFFQWYTSLGGEGTPELSCYKRFQADTAKLSETEKGAYVERLKQTVDGVTFVETILSMQNSEMGAFFAEQERRERPGLFEAYRDLYESGGYLQYAGTLEAERAFVEELYEEERQVAAYGAYLKSVQERGSALAGISIFGAQAESGFSSRNVQKSAADHGGLTTAGIRWAPSKTVVSAMESTWTDVLLILLVFLFVGSLVTEEKQKGLLFITRSTKYGIGHDVSAKLSALLVHCLVSSALFYGANLLFFGCSTGWCDVTARLQSLAPYLESGLSVSIGGYLFLSVLTKALAIFGAGAVLAAACILSENVALPYFVGLALWAGSFALWQFVPAASGAGMAKYLNLFGALRTEKLYGAYINCNVGGYPISRVTLAWMAVGVVALAGVVLCHVFFRQGRSLGIKRGARRLSLPFRPHACLVRYEGYKVLVINRALVILLAFAALVGHRELTRTYSPSVQEQYYRDIMLQLEGGPADEKTNLVEAEAARYREAFGEIQKIDEAVASGELDEETGRAMKVKWEGITAFYPAFQRVEEQHRLVREQGGCYIYDTGYLYVLGVLGDDVLSVFLLASVGIVLAFSHAVSMEHQSGAWGILCATAKGKRGVMTRKAAVCLLSAAVFLSLPFLFRFLSVSAVFPVHGLFSAARNIPFYRSWPRFLPAASLLLLKLFLQVSCGVLLAAATFLFSAWRRNHVQAVFFGFLVLCVPPVLTALGFSFARWFSLYPLYAWGLG